MAHGNYTVTSTQLTANVGEQVNLTTPTVTLTITADPGYTVTHTDFSIGDPLPSEITSAVFSQNGAVVECLLTLDNSFIMPASNVSLPIDIDGTAQAVQYSVAGNYIITTLNTNQANSTVPYSGTGVEGQQITLFTLSFVANANHIFTQPVSAVVSELNQFPANYTVERTNTFSGSNLVQVDFVVKYTFTSPVNVTGDSIKFLASASEVLVPSNLYYSYNLSGGLNNFGGGGSYTFTRKATSLMLVIYGDPGALVNASWTVNGGGPVTLATAEPIRSVGYYKLYLDLPAVGVDTTYLLTLSGDIDPAFAQPNPITIVQQTGVTVTADYVTLAGHTVVRSGAFTFTRTSGGVPLVEQDNYTISAQFSITANDGSILKLLRQPSWADVANKDSATNGGTTILYPPLLGVTGDGTTTVVITMTAIISVFGSTNVSLNLSLANLFNSNPVAVDDYASVSKGGSVFIPVLANDTDGDGHSLTPVILTQPSYGTATVSGSNIIYWHNGTANYADSFTYAANDGYINSNAATVNVQVGIAPGASTQISGRVGIFYVPVVVGEAAGTFTMHFDAGTTPDRVEILYEDAVVADSLFIGDDLTGAGRSAAITTITGTTSLDSFDYVGVGGNGINYGSTTAWNLKALANAVSYSDPTDIAPTGNTRTDPSSNFGGQVGVGNLVYTSASDVIGVTGLDSADGNASVSFTKGAGGDTVAYIKITGVSGTGWNIYQTSFA